MSVSGAHWMVRAGVAVASSLSALALCLTAPPAKAASSFTTALTDSVWSTGGPAWIQRTVATGGRTVLLEVDWTSIEPTPPPASTDPTDPSGTEYQFSRLDALVRQFEGTGISPAFLVSDAPSWAETPGGPSPFEAAGAWKPNATAYGQMARALARRYSGTYQDPVNPGQVLPRVRYFQAWAEANFSVHLAPQWTRSGHTWVPTGPRIYRGLLNAFYAGVKSVHSDNTVITTGLGPYGDPVGACGNHEIGDGCRMRPVMFERELLCLSGQALQTEACPSPANFDVLAADPYEVGGPATHAFNVDDVSAPDIGKLSRVLNKAVRTSRALPRSHKQLWVTEFGYDSNPPNVNAVSLATQARWLEQAFYIFWSEGVNTAVWYLVRDQSRTYNPQNYYSGLYYYGGAPKPSLEAFRFPFVVAQSGHAVKVWGVSPRGGGVTIEHRSGRSWKALFGIRVSAGGVFVHWVPGGLRGSFRAVVSGESSLVWNR